MDINAIVDLYLDMEEAQAEHECIVRLKLSEMGMRWYIIEKSMYMTFSAVYEQIKEMSECFDSMICCKQKCSRSNDAKCPCWWLAGLMESILCMVTEAENEEKST